MKQFLRLCSVVVLILFSVSCVSFQHDIRAPYQDTITVAKRIGNDVVQNSADVTGISIAIMHEGELIYSEGFGKRDIEKNFAVTTETQFNIGSVSKNFTAIAILLLVQEGYVDLDDRVTDILPDFAMNDDSYRDITVRMLLNHTSGMAGTNMNGGFATEKNLLYLPDTFQVLKRSHLKHEPGAFSIYCNDGFTVAQALVEYLSGMSFEQFLQEKLFTPLGLTHTSVGFASGNENIAYAYAQKSLRLPVEYVNIVASGGLASTAEDLIKYAATGFAPSILSQNILEEFLSDQEPYSNDDMDFNRTFTFGLGWDFTSYEPYEEQGLQVLGKTGGTIQYSAMLLVVPETKSAVVLLASGHCDPITTTIPILDILLKETGRIVEKQETIVKAPESEPLNRAYASYAGYYGSDQSVHRVDLDFEQSLMHIFSYDTDQFIPYLTAHHLRNGIFATEDDKQFALRTINGVPSILSLTSSKKAAYILMTRIDDKISVPTHSFITSCYLPTNFSADDLFLQIFCTDIIEELPQYLLLISSNAVPYAIGEAGKTHMVLPALRDQDPPTLLDDKSMLTGGYRCVDVKDIQCIDGIVNLSTGDMQTSVWSKLQGKGTLKVAVPEGGRIIILDSDYTEIVDTLYESQTQIEMDINDGYIACIANTPTEFVVSFVTTKKE